MDFSMCSYFCMKMEDCNAFRITDENICITYDLTDTNIASCLKISNDFVELWMKKSQIQNKFYFGCHGMRFYPLLIFVCYARFSMCSMSTYNHCATDEPSNTPDTVMLQFFKFRNISSRVFKIYNFWYFPLEPTN